MYALWPFISSSGHIRAFLSLFIYGMIESFTWCAPLSPLMGRINHEIAKSIKWNICKYFCTVKENSDKTIIINLFHNEYSVKVLIIHSMYQQKRVFLLLHGPVGIAIKQQTVFKHIPCIYLLCARRLFHVKPVTILTHFSAI